MVVDLDLFEEMLFERETEIAPAVVVAGEVAGDGEYAARLAFETGSEQRSEGERLLAGVLELADVA